MSRADAADAATRRLFRCRGAAAMLMLAALRASVDCLLKRCARRQRHFFTQRDDAAAPLCRYLPADFRC